MKHFVNLLAWLLGKKKFWVSLFVSISVLLGYKFSKPYIAQYSDQIVPTISLLKKPQFIGGTPRKLSVRIKDDLSGIRSVIVTATQGNSRENIFRHSYLGAVTKEGVLTFDFPNRTNQFQAGKVTLTIEAIDKSLYNNKAIETYEIGVDLEPPTVSALTRQHNGVVGGAMMILYQINDRGDTARSGVNFSKIDFEGFPLSSLDEKFTGFPNLYFCIFPLLLNKDYEKDKIKLFAEDPAGNRTLSGFYYTVRKRFGKIRNIDLETEKLTNALRKLTISNEKEAHSNLPLTTKQFQTLRIKIAEETEKKLRHILSNLKASNTARANISLSRVPGAPLAQFLDVNRYIFEGKQIGEELHLGHDFASTANAPVYAAASGEVIFAGELGTYGETVIISHNFGFTTIYGHLSKILVTTGKQIEGGKMIGKTGSSGFASRDHLHFEIRLFAEPINALEWWDRKWIRDHITEKVEEIAKELSLEVTEENQATLTKH